MAARYCMPRCDDLDGTLPCPVVPAACALMPQYRAVSCPSTGLCHGPVQGCVMPQYRDVSCPSTGLCHAPVQGCVMPQYRAVSWPCTGQYMSSPSTGVVSCPIQRCVVIQYRAVSSHMRENNILILYSCTFMYFSNRS